MHRLDPRSSHCSCPVDDGSFVSLRVEMPMGTYPGHQLTRLVRTNTAPATAIATPTTPATPPVKYTINITAPMTNRSMRSTIPMFFLICSPPSKLHSERA
jgi:hypothetical protein